MKKKSFQAIVVPQHQSNSWAPITIHIKSRMSRKQKRKCFLLTFNRLIEIECGAFRPNALKIASKQPLSQISENRGYFLLFSVAMPPSRRLIFWLLWWQRSQQKQQEEKIGHNCPPAHSTVLVRQPVASRTLEAKKNGCAWAG
jgi:hypothetical protein